MSITAREAFPLVCEMKNQEAFNVWGAFEQCLEHHNKLSPEDQIKYYPIVFYKRNHSDIMMTMKADDFFKLIS